MSTAENTDGTVGVVHLIDALNYGGAERSAIGLVNHLPRERYHVGLCTSRYDGPLAQSVADHVDRIRLERRSQLNTPAAASKLSKHMRKQNVRILHAHSSSIYLAKLTSFLPPRPAVLWHIHSGAMARKGRPGLPLRLAVREVDGVICVTDELVAWAREHLPVPSDRIWYLQNMVVSAAAAAEAPALPGQTGARILCVANIRPEKDHLTLVRAFRLVSAQHQTAHLILAGAIGCERSHSELTKEITEAGLQERVSYIGPRADVEAVMRACDIGVLSSRSEGLPVALLEYGAAGLAVASTGVGQIPDVLEKGRCGLIASPGSPEELAGHLLRLLNETDLRQRYATGLRQRVAKLFGTDAVLEKLLDIYDQVLCGQKDARPRSAPKSAQCRPSPGGNPTVRRSLF